MGEGIGEGDAGRPIPGGPGDLGMRRAGRSLSSYPWPLLDVPSAIALARSSLYAPVRLWDRPLDASDSDRSREAFDGGRDPERLVPLLSLLS